MLAGGAGSARAPRCGRLRAGKSRLASPRTRKTPVSRRTIAVSRAHRPRPPLTGPAMRVKTNRRPASACPAGSRPAAPHRGRCRRRWPTSPRRAARAASSARRRRVGGVARRTRQPPQPPASFGEPAGRRGGWLEGERREGDAMAHRARGRTPADRAGGARRRRPCPAAAAARALLEQIGAAVEAAAGDPGAHLAAPRQRVERGEETIAVDAHRLRRADRLPVGRVAPRVGVTEHVQRHRAHAPRAAARPARAGKRRERQHLRSAGLGCRLGDESRAPPQRPGEASAPTSAFAHLHQQAMLGLVLDVADRQRADAHRVRALDRLGIVHHAHAGHALGGTALTSAATSSFFAKPRSRPTPPARRRRRRRGSPRHRRSRCAPPRGRRRDAVDGHAEARARVRRPPRRRRCRCGWTAPRRHRPAASTPAMRPPARCRRARRSAGPSGLAARCFSTAASTLATIAAAVV